MIGAKAVHLQKTTTARNGIEDRSVDIGAAGKEEAEALVKIGDYATFDTAPPPSAAVLAQQGF